MEKSRKRGIFLATIFLKKNRRGSHVGMILSFVIFITFIVFLYTVVKPAISTGEDKTTTLEYVESKIAENVSSNLTSVGVQINSNSNPGPRCVQLQNFFAFLDVTPLFSAIVKNETGAIQEAYKGSAAPNTNLVINRNNKNNLFFEVDFSPEFDGLDANALSCNSVITYYNFSLIRTETYVYQKNMYDLMDYYNHNYDNLKNELKVPPGNEFGFGFKPSNGTVVDVGGKGVSNIYATETPIQYFDDNATVQSGFIEVKVW